MIDRQFRAVVLDLFDTLVKWSPQRLPEMEIHGRRVRSTIPLLVPALERGFGEAFRLPAFVDAYSAVMSEIERERLARGVEVTCTERFRRTLERLHAPAVASLAEELTRTHMSAVRAVTAAPRENAAVVERLAPRYRLGLLSNFDDARTGREILADTGVAEHFAVVVISAEVDVRKPNPVIFRLLLDRLRLAADEVLFVGDTAHEDVAGARAAGIPVVWLSENKGPFPPDIASPDYTIRNLTELPALLGVP
jgi:HAD superfamily hydrolase (TIGR01549 family)